MVQYRLEGKQQEKELLLVAKVQKQAVEILLQ